MFVIGFIRGTILGVTLGLMSSLIVKNICKKRNKIAKSNDDKKKS